MKKDNDTDLEELQIALEDAEGEITIVISEKKLDKKANRF